MRSSWRDCDGPRSCAPFSRAQLPSRFLPGTLEVSIVHHSVNYNVHNSSHEGSIVKSTTLTVCVDTRVKKRSGWPRIPVAVVRFSPPRPSTNISKSMNGRSPVSSAPSPPSIAARGFRMTRSGIGSLLRDARTRNRRPRGHEPNVVARGHCRSCGVAGLYCAG
jgi:hypothetical protein